MGTHQVGPKGTTGWCSLRGASGKLGTDPARNYSFAGRKIYGEVVPLRNCFGKYTSVYRNNRLFGQIR